MIPGFPRDPPPPFRRGVFSPHARVPILSPVETDFFRHATTRRCFAPELIEEDDAFWIDAMSMGFPSLMVASDSVSKRQFRASWVASRANEFPGHHQLSDGTR